MIRLLFVGTTCFPDLPGFVLHRARTLPAALSFLATAHADVIVLGPEFSAPPTASHLRHASLLPLLCLTEPATPQLTVSLLGEGAQAVLDARVDPAELGARLRALRRRHGPSEAFLQAAPLTLDLKARVVRYGQASLVFTPQEFEVLTCLARHAGRVCSREVLMEALWGHVCPARSPAVDRYVSNIRQRLRVVGAGGLLWTARGRGWGLRVRLEKSSDGGPRGVELATRSGSNVRPVADLLQETWFPS